MEGIDPSLIRVLTALPLKEGSPINWLLYRLFSLCQTAPWLAPALAGESSEVSELLRELEAAASNPLQLTAVRVGDDELVARLHPRVSFQNYGQEALRAVLLASMASRQLIPKLQPPSDSALRVLGSFIAGLDQRREGTKGFCDRFGLENPRSIIQLVACVDAGFSGLEVEAAKSWQQSVRPFLLDLDEWLAKRTKAPPPPYKPPTTPPDQNDPPSGWYPPRIVIVDDDDELVDLDPPSITNPAVRRPPNWLIQASYDVSRRHSNRWLSKAHVTVSTDQQIALILKSADELTQTTVFPEEIELGKVVWILAVVTGLEGVSQGALQIGLHGELRSTDRHHIDLESGILWRYVPTPTSIYRPPPSALNAFEVSIPWIPLALPIRLLSALRKLCSARQHPSLASLFRGHSPDDLARQFIQFVMPHAASAELRLSRYRNWLPAQLQQIGLDLSATMVLTQGAQGRSASPLNYYCPKASHLQNLFQKALEPIMGISAGSVEADYRIGPASIILEDVAEAGAAQLVRRLSVNPQKAAKKAETLSRFSNALTANLAHAIALITLHRPTRNLFELGRWSFDLTRHMAFIADKQVDAAHVPRIVATTPKLSASVGGYLSHLAAVCSHSMAPDATRERLQKVLDGDLPLLCWFDSDLAVRRMTLDDFKAATPDAWKEVNLNWYRAFAANHLRELGVPAACVSVQLGHLDAACQPFSSEGVASPLEYLDPLRTGLEKLEQRLGLRELSGLHASGEVLGLRGLRSFAQDLIDQEKTFKAHLEAQKLRKESILKAKRVGALDWLERRLPEALPSFAKLAEAVASHTSSTDYASINAELKGLKSLLLVELSEEPALVVAIHDEVCRRVRKFPAGIRSKLVDIGLFMVAPPAEPSPFLIRHGLATMQLDRVRRHIFQGRAERRVNVFRQRVLALTLLDGLLSCDEVLVAAGCRELVSTPGMPDWVTLVSDDGQRHWQFCGLAAQMLAATPAIQPEAESEATLDQWICALLPPELRPENECGALRMLVELANLCARVEASGLARSTLPEGCSRPTLARDQAAFYAGQFPIQPQHGTRDESEASTINPVDPSEPTERQRSIGRSIHDRLSRLGAAVRGQHATRHRNKNGRVSLADIRSAMLQARPQIVSGGRLDVVNLLADFALDLVENGTVQKKKPAPSTIDTYFSAIAKPLAAVFGIEDLRQLDEEDLLGAAELASASCSDQQSFRRTVSQLNEFFAFAHRAHRLPLIRLFVPNDGDMKKEWESYPLISDGQYQSALRCLGNWRDGELGTGLEDAFFRRRCGQAKIALILIRRFGLRMGEVVDLQWRDVGLLDCGYLSLRPNVFRRLKSNSDSRRIRIQEVATEHEYIQLRDFLLSERRLRDPSPGDRLFVASPAEAQGVGPEVLRRVLQAAFQATGCRQFWPHLLRHAWLSDRAKRVLESSAAVGARLTSYSSETLFRDLDAVRIEAGHSSLKTGFAHYVQTRQLLRGILREDWRLPGAGRQLYAGALGCSVDVIDKRRLRQRSREKSTVCWRSLDNCIAEGRNFLRKVPRWQTSAEQPKCAVPPAMPTAGRFTPKDLDTVLRIAGDSESLDKIAPVSGLLPHHVLALETAIKNLAGAKCRYRIFADKTQKGKLAREPLARRFECLNDLAPPTSPSRELSQRAEDLLNTMTRPSRRRLDKFEGDHVQHLDAVKVLRELGLAAEFSTEGKAAKLPRGQYHLVVRYLAVSALWGSVA